MPVFVSVLRDALVVIQIHGTAESLLHSPRLLHRKNRQIFQQFTVFTLHPLNGPSQFVCIFHADPCSGNVLVHIGNGKRHLGYCCLCKTIDSQCSFYSLQFFLRCRKADTHLCLGRGEVKLDLRFFLSDKLIILLAEHIARIGIGAAMLGIVFCADFCEVQIGTGCFGESGVTLNLTGNSDIAAKRHI